MRLLRINDIIADIDEQTAIGITYSAFDVREPGKPRVAISNNFSIPKTSKNLAIFGNPNDPQSTSITVYQSAIADYYVNNTRFLRSAKVRVTEINERIELLIYEKSTFWESLADLSWYDFTADLLLFLNDTKGYPISGDAFVGTFTDFVDLFLTNTDGLIIPYVATKSSFLTPEYTGANLWITDEYNGVKGGIFCIYAKTIFEYFEWKYGVDFGANAPSEIFNALNDAVIQSIYIPIRGIVSVETGTGFYLSAALDSAPYMGTAVEVQDKPSKNMSDFFRTFCGYFNLIKDEYYFGNQYYIRLYRFDNIENSNVIDWSGKIEKIKSFKPLVDGYARKSYIKYGSVFTGGDAYTQAVRIDVANDNLSPQSDVLAIDAYVPATKDPTGFQIAIDMTDDKCNDTFIFLATDGTYTASIAYKDITNVNHIVTKTIDVAALYSIQSEYIKLKSVMEYPKFWTAGLWLNPVEIERLSFFSLIYIRELNGSFFLNKIDGYNPDKARQATTIELIRVSDKTPSGVGNDYWVDGVFDAWTDGAGEIYY